MPQDQYQCYYFCGFTQSLPLGLGFSFDNMHLFFVTSSMKHNTIVTNEMFIVLDSQNKLVDICAMAPCGWPMFCHVTDKSMPGAN